MQVILPKDPATKVWGMGDVIVFNEKAFIVCNAGVSKYVGLVELENGASWFGNCAESCLKLQKVVTSQKNVTAHYPKNDYRIYIEGP